MLSQKFVFPASNEFPIYFSNRRTKKKKKKKEKEKSTPRTPNHRQIINTAINNQYYRMVIATEGLNRNHVLFRNERQGREDLALEERRGKLMIREMKDFDKSRKKQREIEASIEAARQGLYTGSPLSDGMRSPRISSRTGSPGRRSGSRGAYSISPRFQSVNSETEDLRARIKAKNIAPPLLDSPSPTSPRRGHSLSNSLNSSGVPSDRKVVELQALLDQERARNHALDFEKEKFRHRSHQDAHSEVEELRSKLQNTVYQTTVLENSQREVHRLESKVTELTQQLSEKTLSARSMQVRLETKQEDAITLEALRSESSILRERLRLAEERLVESKSTPRTREVTPRKQPISSPSALPVPPLVQLYSEASEINQSRAMEVLKSGRGPSAVDEELVILKKQIAELSHQISETEDASQSTASSCTSLTAATLIGAFLVCVYIVSLYLSMGATEDPSFK